MICYDVNKHQYIDAYTIKSFYYCMNEDDIGFNLASYSYVCYACNIVII